MSLEKSFAYFTHHSESITQWLCLATLLLVAAIVARALFVKRTESESAHAMVLAGASPELQGTLSKIIEQISRLEGLNLKGMTSSEVAGVDLEVQTLKANLHAREAEIAELRSNAGGAPPGEGISAGLAAESAGLGQRIRELEAKLAEYEILEDDIADLSLYKEENVRLRSELERLKAAPPAPVVAESEPPAPEPAPVGAPARGIPSAVSAAAASAAEAASALMADFESTTKAERETHAAEVPPMPAAVAAPPAPTSVENANEADDLFAEFASVAAGAENPNFGSGNLDTEKVMAEMAALSALAVTGVDNALEESIDIDKMALEAKAPGKA